MFDADWYGWQKWIEPRDSQRGFTARQKWFILKQQHSKCAICGRHIDVNNAQFHHREGWADGGRTIVSNGIAVCPPCHYNLHNQ